MRVILLATLALLVATTWVATRGRGAEPSTAAVFEVPSSNAPAAAAEPLTPPQAVQAHAAAPGRSAIAPDPRSREPEGIEETRSAPQPRGDFAWKYGQNALDELTLARALLSEELEERIAAFGAAAFETGAFEQRALSSEEAQDLERLVAALQRPQEWTHTRVVVDSEGVGRSAPRSTLQIARVRRADHPELVELESELAWLEWKIAGLGRK
jgi:hypothetical protein